MGGTGLYINAVVDGYVLNELKLPIIVKDVNLTVDSIDVEKLLTGVNNGENNDVNNTEQDANKNDSGYKIEDNVLIIDMH